MGTIFKKEPRTTLVEKVADRIRDAIKTGKLNPGARLIESEIAAEMQISRYPIREAIRYLEKEGLVTNVPYKGAHVTNFSRADLKEVYSLRVALEELAIRTLIENLDKNKIKQLEQSLVAMKRAALKGEMDEYVDADLRFHLAICELSGHKRLLEVWRNLEHQIRNFIMFADQPHESDAPMEIYHEHSKVIEAIKNSDTDRAVKQMQKILKEGYLFVSGNK
jgi:DNA-binding GntR family transcriptional regulator